MAASSERQWKRFGSWLKQERERAGKSQKELARLAGIHPVQISRIETGESGTKIETLDALIVALKLDKEKAYKTAGFIPEIISESPTSDDGLADRVTMAIRAFKDLTPAQRKRVLKVLFSTFEDLGDESKIVSRK